MDQQVNLKIFVELVETATEAQTMLKEVYGIERLLRT